MQKLLLIIGICFIAIHANAQKTIKFESSDEVEITADLYEVESERPVILLFHQAGYSRGEYKEIAPKLNELGFTCIAVDLRSGNNVNGVKNKTAACAKKKELPTDYLDAEPDMTAAIDYVTKNHSTAVILVGSSYSASLALKVGRGNRNVIGVAAFSPGEYFPEDLNLRESIKGFKRPHL